MPDLRPCTKLFVQFDGGYYAIPFDATTGIVIVPGTGVGTLSHAGKTYAITAADPSATTAAGSAARADLVAALALPIATVTPDTFAAALASGSFGMLDLQPGHYMADFTVPEGP